jgi:hypothetical protein
MSRNVYLTEVQQNLPRLLALFDADATGKSYGLGDRYYWAWGLIDFGNATFQGAVHGMARLWASGLWPYPTPKQKFLDRVDSLFQGVVGLTRKDGSLEEAFPHEGSFCVTALVAFDLLCTVDLLSDDIEEGTRERWRRVIQPLITFLLRADETHAVISNHLATAAAALIRWHRLTGQQAAERRAQELVRRIVTHQSEEGWFLEYAGADPGYQSLCTYYLADVHLLRPDCELGEPLRRSLGFLWHFAHPDGSFGGVYGSRATRLYCPPGVLALAAEVGEASALAAFMEESIAAQRVVTLSAMDEPNLVPMFNAYCWAAALSHASDPALTSQEYPTIPAQSGEPFRRRFPQAGLMVDRGARHYTVVNTHKGGVVAHFRDDAPALIDAGVVVRNRKGILGSSQAFSPENPGQLDGDRLTVDAGVGPMPKQLPTPLKFLALRLLCVTFFRSYHLRERVKQWLVWLLITRRQRWPVRNRRTIHLGPDLAISDELTMANGFVRENAPRAFISIHMASQGYWQCQDEEGP